MQTAAPSIVAGLIDNADLFGWCRTVTGNFTDELPLVEQFHKVQRVISIVNDRGIFPTNQLRIRNRLNRSKRVNNCQAIRSKMFNPNQFQSIQLNAGEFRANTNVLHCNQMQKRGVGKMNYEMNSNECIKNFADDCAYVGCTRWTF